MFGLPMVAVIVIIIAIAALILVAGLVAVKRRDISFARFFGIKPKSGTEESVASVVQASLAEMEFDLQTEKGLMGFFSGRASEAPSREKRLQLHADTEGTRQRELQLESRLAQAVTVAAHFGHVNVVRELGLNNYLPVKVANH